MKRKSLRMHGDIDKQIQNKRHKIPQEINRKLSEIGPFTFKQKCSKTNFEEIFGDKEDAENKE
ncbi:hypothetical protein J14TS5_45350 [Paenibacillus lautus]|nr:hypothetical protein J14TS5_45350 [Paenibacillus lautus]